jgi:hypothetical protein
VAAAIRANTTTSTANNTVVPLPGIPLLPPGGAHEVAAGGGKQITCSNKQTVIAGNYVSTTHEGGQTCTVNDWCVTGTVTAPGQKTIQTMCADAQFRDICNYYAVNKCWTQLNDTSLNVG